eukprot:m.156279 g.156279  ORF g.156279 m.156279 type:complete len:359 (-) comp16438_c0_seq3:1826-2902(-)
MLIQDSPTSPQALPPQLAALQTSSIDNDDSIPTSQPELPTTFSLDAELDAYVTSLEGPPSSLPQLREAFRAGVQAVQQHLKPLVTEELLRLETAIAEVQSRALVVEKRLRLGGQVSKGCQTTLKDMVNGEFNTGADSRPHTVKEWAEGILNLPTQMQIGLGDLLTQRAAQQQADRSADDDLAQLLHLSDDDLDARLFGQLVKHDAAVLPCPTTAMPSTHGEPMPYNLFKKAEQGELFHGLAASQRIPTNLAHSGSPSTKAVNASPRQGRRRAHHSWGGVTPGRGQVAVPRNTTTAPLTKTVVEVGSEAVSRHGSRNSSDQHAIRSGLSIMPADKRAKLTSDVTPLAKVNEPPDVNDTA